MAYHSSPSGAEPWVGYERPKHEQDLIELIEKEALCDDMNIEHLVNEYRRSFPGQAVWRLSQDIQQQAFIWYNVLETLKKNGPGKARPTGLKEWYEKTGQDGIGALPTGSLSNPWWQWDLDQGFKRLRNYSKGLVKLARTFSVELLAELNFEASIGSSVEVQLGFPPALTIGVHKGAKAGFGLGAGVSPRA